MLLRGINVGGKNPVPMARLREVLGELGYEDVVTYIASGNVILSSKHGPDRIKREIEAALPKAFKLHSELDRRPGPDRGPAQGRRRQAAEGLRRSSPASTTATRSS